MNILKKTIALLFIFSLNLFIGQAQIDVTTIYQSTDDKLGIAGVEFKDNGIYFYQENFLSTDSDFLVKLNEADPNNSSTIHTINSNTRFDDIAVDGNNLYYLKSENNKRVFNIYKKDLLNSSQNDALIVSDSELKVIKPNSSVNIQDIEIHGANIYLLVTDSSSDFNAVVKSTIYYKDINTNNAPFQELISKTGEFFYNIAIENDFLYYNSEEKEIYKIDLNNPATVEEELFNTTNLNLRIVNHVLISDTEVITALSNDDFEEDLSLVSFADPNNPIVTPLEFNGTFDEFSNLSKLNNEVYFTENITVHNSSDNSLILKGANIHKFTYAEIHKIPVNGDNSTEIFE